MRDEGITERHVPVDGGDGGAERERSDDAFPHEAGRFAAFGQGFVIRCTDPALAGFLHQLYAPMARPSSAADVAGVADVAVYLVASPTDGRDGWVSRDGQRIGSSPRRARVLGYLQWAINRQVIERSVDERLVLHAAAAERDGVAVVLPAVMESGKTTLVTGLLDRGLGYLTDEAASVTTDLVMEGYPKPLSIDPGSFGVLSHHRPSLSDGLTGYLDDQWQVAPHDIAPVVERSPLGLLVFPSYRRGAVTSLERLRPSGVIALAAPCTFGREGAPIGTWRLRRLAAIAARVPAYRLISGDLDQACRAVIDALDTARTGHVVQPAGSATS